MKINLKYTQLYCSINNENPGFANDNDSDYHCNSDINDHIDNDNNDNSNVNKEYHLIIETELRFR